jgi:hypothetical protein
MTTILPSILAILIVAIIFLRWGADARASRGWKIAALVPLGLQVAILLLFGIGEMASGDLSGAGHLLQVAVVVLIGLLAWKRPLEGGIALLLTGAIALAQFRDATAAILILAAPQIVSGSLFLIGAFIARKK